MKNSLFKRAFATAAAVPLALTQCLTVANAASINNADIAAVENETVAAADKAVTLNGEGGLVYITPGKEADGNDYYEKSGDDANGYTFVKDSTWNETALGKLTSISKKSGKIDISEYRADAVKRAGNYKESAAKIAAHYGDVNYTISDEGDITLTCELSDIVPDITGGDSRYKGITVAGTYTVIIKGSSLDDTKVEAEAYFTSDAGKVYKGSAMADYALEKIAELRAASADGELTKDAIYLEKQFKRVSAWTDKALAKVTEEKTYATFPELVAAAKASRFGQKAEARLKKELPSSATEAASKATALKYYEKAISQLNSGAGIDVQISAKDLGDFADAIKNVKAQLNAGTATFYGEFDDDEASAVADYFMSEYGLQVTKSYKTVDVTADYSGVKNGEASVDFQMKRVVEAVTTTTTTETTTTTTETTTTTSDTTTSTTDTTTSTTDTTTSTTDTTTSTTDTTTSTTETTTPGETTTTTRTEYKTVTNYTVAAKTGFYLNIDKEFNKDQIESISYSIDESYISYDEEGNVVNQVIDKKGTDVDITDKVDFGTQTPANVFTEEEPVFSHLIDIYASEDIEGVAKAGDKLVKYNGQDLSVVAYVGVKGDANLDFKAESKDASVVQVWYAKMSTGKDPETEVFSTSDLITYLDENGERVVREDYDKTLDDFAAFLCDVDNENAEDNWYALKPARKVINTDASFILAMYSKASVGVNPDRESWNSILGDFAKAE